MQTDNNRRHRYRWSCQILYEHYTEFMNCQRLKNEIAAERGWSLATFWIATAGGLNEFFLEREYESLGQLAVELEARDTDIDFMRDAHVLQVRRPRLGTDRALRVPQAGGVGVRSSGNGLATTSWTDRLLLRP